jgi:putative SOS response-associated peptidase YedK
MVGLGTCRGGDAQTISCVTILTTEPNELMTPIQDRMPVVLPRDDEQRWLSADPDERKAFPLVQTVTQIQQS